MDTRYVVQNLLPAREVSILAGASGVGKSTFLMQMVAAIVNGETAFMGHDISHPQRVAYIAADRTFDSYTELAARVGLDLRRLQTRSLVDDDTIDVTRLERDPMELLMSMIASFRSPTLVIIDPMVIFLGVDPNRYQQVAPRLIRMGRWCRANNYTIMATHHATKARSDYSFMRPQDRISGSSALLGFTSSQLFLSGPDEIKKPYAEFIAVNHNAPPEVIKLARNDRGLFAPWRAESVNEALTPLILSAVAKKGAPMSKKEIEAATRIDPNTLGGLLDALVDAEVLSGKGKTGYVIPVAAAVS